MARLTLSENAGSHSQKEPAGARKHLERWSCDQATSEQAGPITTALVLVKAATAIALSNLTSR